MSRLELLKTVGDCLEDILRTVQSPEYLIWLHCHGFPYASLPRWIPMERLTVLDVQGEKLGRLWGERNFQVYGHFFFVGNVKIACEIFDFVPHHA
jgi:hypothetical protein